MSAFHGDPGIKSALLAALDAGEPLPLVARPVAWAERVAWAEAVGLPTAVALLAAHLAERLGGEAPDAAVAREVLEAIEPGADLTAMPFRMALWAWQSAPDALRGATGDAGYLAAGAAAAALHDRAAGGAAVARGEWRAARARLGRLGDGEGEETAAARVMAAGAWDFRVAPGAITDLFWVWNGLLIARVEREEGWSEADAAHLQARLHEWRDGVLTRLGPTPDDEIAAAAHRRARVAELRSFLNAAEDPVLRRRGAVQTRIGEVSGALREATIAALVSLLRAAAAP